MSQQRQRPKWHLVCRGCSAEGVEEDKRTAEALKEWHEDKHGHTVVVEEITGGEA